MSTSRKHDAINRARAAADQRDRGTTWAEEFEFILGVSSYQVLIDRCVNPIADLTRLLEVGERPVWDTGEEDTLFFRNHPLRNLGGRGALSEEQVRGVLAWLESLVSTDDEVKP